MQSSLGESIISDVVGLLIILGFGLIVYMRLTKRTLKDIIADLKELRR